MTAELMHRAQTGDVDAFGELYAIHYGEVRAYAESRHPGHGDDIAQEAFIRALRSLHTWRDQGVNVGAWLRTIVANTCINRARSAHYRRSVPVDFTDHDAFATLRDERPEGDPEGVVLDRLRNATLQEALLVLTEDQRACLAHRFVDGLSTRQTANVMGRGENAVKALRMRAVRALGVAYHRAVADA